MSNLPNVTSLFAQCRYFWRRRYTVLALFVAWLLYLVVVICFAIAGHFSVHAFWGLIPIFIAWVYFREIAHKHGDETLVLFCPHASDSEEELLYKLSDRFRDAIANRNLKAFIRYEVLPGHIDIKSAQDADKFLINLGATLLIYGRYECAPLNGKQVKGFPRLMFRLRHQPLREDQFDPFVTSVVQALHKRAFAYLEENEWTGLNVVTEHLTDVSLYLVALALSLDGAFEKAISILEPLHINNSRGLARNANNPQLQAFDQAVRRCFIGCLEGLYQQEYYSNVLPKITKPEANPYVERCEQLLSKTIELQANKREGYALNLAIMQFHKGDIARAKNLIRTSIKTEPANVFGAHLSLAFLHLWQGDYIKAIAAYRSAEATGIKDETMVKSVLMFLSTMIGLHPDIISLKFGLALVNDCYYDHQIAKAMYEQFLTSCPDTNRFRPLRDHSIARLKAL